MSHNYYTSSDAQIILLNHPDETQNNVPLDVAHFELTGGRSPIHIWNYTYRKPGSDYLQEGVAGGARFDDTALGNQLVELQLIVNRERLKSFHYAFRSMTRIGDIELRYQAVSERLGEEPRASTVGYRLINGHVGQTAGSMELSSPLHQSIRLYFQDIEPLNYNKPTVEAQLFELEEAVATSRVFPDFTRLLKYDVAFTTDTIATERVYHPSFVKTNAAFTTTFTLNPNAIFAGESTLQYNSVRELPFSGAMIESITQADRILWVWDPRNPLGAQYTPILRSNSTYTPIIEDGAIPNSTTDILTGALSGLYLLQSSEGLNLLDSNGNQLLVQVD